MKVSHTHKICYVLPEYREGLDTHFSYIEGLLTEANKDLETFLIIEKGSYPSVNFGCKKIKVINSGNIIFRFFRFMFWMLRARKWGARDYYVHYSYLSAFIASIIVKVFGGRVFYWNCGETWKYQRPFFREKFERLTYRMVTFLVTGTEHLADEYARFYEIPRKKVKVMPNWVDTKRFKRVLDKPDLRKELEILQDRKVVFFVHHLSFRKGSRMILPVVRDLLKVRKDFFFVIAGSGPDEESLRSRVENTDRLASYVRIIGPVANSRIQKYFGAADIFFMPSQEEGFPRVILEAMAAGVPMVMSDVGSVSEIVPKMMLPFIVDPNDAQGFVNALNALLSQSEGETEIMKTELRRRAAEFETATVAKIFVKLFNE